ncbi:MAG: hypothetical protein E7662_11155 [Ruminococcaceae bacterium]|nr:hypothetical protein [Oscillospiraceae bacterium]
MIPATENVPGIMKYTCTVCSGTKNGTIPTLDHVHTWLTAWSKNADKHWHTCSGCDDISDEADHIWDTGVVTKPATESETGIRTYTCTVCGAEKTETVYPPVILSGTVKDGTAEGANSGKAISGVTVEFFSSNGTSIGTAVTDAAGVYSFSFAQTGTYKCVFTKTGYKTVTAASLIINADTVSLGTVTMEEESRIAAQGTIGRSGSWVLMSDGTLTVSGSFPNYGTNSGDTGNQPWAAYKNDIKKVVVSEGITQIGRYAFASCPNLREVVIPGTVKTLGKGAFEGCTGLHSIVLPTGVSSIADSCFKNCSNLKAAYFYGTPPATFGTDVFSGTASGFTVYYREGVRWEGAQWSSPTWKGYPTATFVPGEEISSVYTVSGRITSFGTLADITVELLQGDAVIRTVTVPAGSDTYTIADVPAGTYTLRISKPKHVTRTYTVVIQNP